MEDKEKKCRVCLRLEKPRKLINLFDGKSQNAERIFSIAGIRVDDNYKNHLPDKVCFKCSDSLMRAALIRSLCIESDKFLRKQLLDLNLIKLEKPTLDATQNTEMYISPTIIVNSEESFVKVEAAEDFDIPADQPAAPEFDFFETYREDSDSENEEEEIFPSPPETKAAPATRGPRIKPEICEICGKTYSSTYIATHLMTHSDSGVESSKFQCDVCGLQFTLKSYVYSHMMNVHCSSKKWRCEVCGKSYAKKNTWTNHIRTHRPDGRIYKCKVENCGKSFAQANKLSVHMRIHNNERPYTCSFCFRSFIHFTDHKRHVMGHTGERPYKCTFPTCLRGFIKKSELTAHERTHQR